MSESEHSLFPNRSHNWFIALVVVIAVVLITTGHTYPIAPFENMDLSRPLILPLLILIVAVIAYSWWCCGGDHKDESDFPIGKRGWWREKKDE